MKNQPIQADLIAHAYQNLPAMLLVNFAAVLGAAIVFSSHDSAIA